MRAILVAAAVVCLSGAAPRWARACDNAVELEMDPRIPMVASASAALDKDDPVEAVKRVSKAFPKLRTATLDGDGLRSRAMRVMAVATVRLDAAVTVASARDAQERDAGYAWALQVLRGLAVRRPTDPATMTDLGEALSKRAPTHAEARKILELLAPRDLITNAYGWAALARVRLASGDTEGRAAAVERCAKMARVIAVCKVRGDAISAGT